MLLIKNTEIDPYFNLASEEYLLENSREDVFMLWRNDRAVIIGKNQNAFAEINIPYIRQNNIKAVRRLTGGGAVFHDIGNINFTFITDADRGTELDFARFEEPVIHALAEMGVSAKLDGRNDIIADGCKISGNAQCRYNTADGRCRLMHHGTLLFSADMAGMSASLNVSSEKLRSKGIKSVRQRVSNIASLPSYNGPAKAEDFMDALIMYISENAPVRAFTAEEKRGIRLLSDEKYSRWEWNFGASPAYDLEISRRFPFGSVEVMMTASEGTIRDISICGDFFGVGDVNELCRSLVGVRLEPDALAHALDRVGEYIFNADAQSIASLILNG